MTFDPERHHRRSVRLTYWDYASAAAYFVTICCADRARVLAVVEDGTVVRLPAGHVVQEC
jgi:hypothetical protein